VKGLIFTYGLTLGGAAVSLYNPFVGLVVYVCFAILRPQFLWSYSVPMSNYSRLVAFALLVGWTARSFGRWREESGEQRLLPAIGTFGLKSLLSGVALLVGCPLKELGRAQLILGLLVHFWLWSVIGMLFADDFGVAQRFVEFLSKVVLIFVVGLSTIDSTAKLKQLAWVIVLSQGYVAYELNLSYYLDGYNRLIEENFGEMDNNCNAITMVTCVGLAFFLGLSSSKWPWKLLGMTLALLMAHVVLFSFSRGGQLALVVAGVVSFFLVPKKPVYYVAFLGAALLAFRLAGPEVRERFATIFADSAQRDSSAESRVILWSNCWDTMLNNPILGVGPDHFPLIVQQYGWPKGKEAHTLWLQLGAELGFPGLLLVLAFFSVTTVQVWLLSRRQDLPDPWLQNVGRMVVPSLLGFMVSAQFVSLKGLDLPYYVALIGAGALKLAAMPPGGLAADATGEEPQEAAAPAPWNSEVR
jgi:O-antigen ligase